MQTKEINKCDFYTLLEDFRNALLRAKGVLEFDGKRIFIDVVNGTVYSRPVMSASLNLKKFDLGVTFILREYAYKSFMERIQPFL
jgi:hypothetical protein